MQMTITVGDDGQETRSSSYCWWRSSEEFDEKGHPKIDLSDVSNLTPRLKLIREMERLALIAPDCLDDLRHRLMSYSPGDLYIPTGGIQKEELKIPPLITILLVGFRGSGKSSLINLMYTVLGRSGLIPFAQTSGSSGNGSTMCLEEHNVLRSASNGFCVFDSRGMDYENMAESFQGLWCWMEDGVRHHQECWREGDEELNRSDQALGYSCSCWFEYSSRYAKRRVDCVWVVANVAEIYGAVKAGDLKPLKATKELFYCPPINKCNAKPMLILTHGDELSAEERLLGRLMICEFLSIPVATGAYDIACLNAMNGVLTNEWDPVTAYTLAEAVYRALVFSDRTHPIKRDFKDWVVLCIYTILGWMAALFAFLADFFSKFDKKAGKLKQG